MSGITGIYNFHDRPADRALLQQMTDAIAHRGPDGIHHWFDGVVGFGHLMFHTTPESLREKQPWPGGGGALCITLDGRVDNRSKVRAALQSKGLAPRTDADAELVLRAYECWGEDCPRQLLGDFAFAIWDRRNRKLFCARDLMGVRPFYYLFDGCAFTFSSELRPLLDAPRFQRRLNLGMLGEYLCDNIQNREETLYQNIFRLPAAHRLVLHDGTLRVTRYFQIDPERSIRYRSDDEYAEHFFDIFKEAVRCRLRSQTPVSVFLSGGLDSSSILGIAGQLANEGDIGNGRLMAYTLASLHPDADELRYAHDAARMWGGAVRVANIADAVAEPFAAQVERFLDLPDFPSMTFCQPLYDMARQDGSRVSLWGFGGDEWLTGHRVHCADLIRGLQITKLIRQLRHDLAIYRTLGGRQGAMREAIQWCVYPLVPRALKSLVKRNLRWNVPRWISPAFARAINLQDRLGLHAGAPAFPTLAQQAIHGSLESGYDALSYELGNRFDSGQAMEGRYPFLDRRIIEFALAIPEDQRWRDDQTKYVLRQAMRRHLPESIRHRRTKADFSYTSVEALEKESAGKLFESMRLATEGYVDAAVIQDMYSRCRKGDIRLAGPLIMILALEYWMNKAFTIAS